MKVTLLILCCRSEFLQFALKEPQSFFLPLCYFFHVSSFLHFCPFLLPFPSLIVLSLSSSQFSFFFMPLVPPYFSPSLISLDFLFCVTLLISYSHYPPTSFLHSYLLLSAANSFLCFSSFYHVSVSICQM